MESMPIRPSQAVKTDATPLTTVVYTGVGALLGPATYPHLDPDYTVCQDAWIPVKRFRWSENDSIGKVLVELDTKEVFHFQGTAWQCFAIDRAQHLSYGVAYLIDFVKIPNLCVSVEIVHRYSHPWNSSTTNKQDPEMHVYEIRDETALNIEVMPYWNGVKTLNFSEAYGVAPYFANVKTTISVRLPYVPNNLQPKTFECVVFARPICVDTSGTIVTNSKNLLFNL